MPCSCQKESTRCEKCKKYRKKYYAEHREQEIARAQKHNRKKSRAEINIYKRKMYRKNPIWVLLSNAKARAKKKGVPFDIGADDLKIPKVCPVLGIEIGVNDGKCKDSSLSLDRIIPEAGYIKGNVAIISHKANTIKSNATIEDIENVLEYMKSHEKKESA